MHLLAMLLSATATALARGAGPRAGRAAAPALARLGPAAAFSAATPRPPGRDKAASPGNPDLHTLRLRLAAAEAAYYDVATTGSSALTDAEYDALVASERALTRTLGLAPRLAVGAPPALDAFAAAAHAAPMLSLDNVRTAAELDAFVGRVVKGLPDADAAAAAAPLAFVAEPKVDGLSLALTYVDRKLVRAATRGDGKVGEDVTAAAAADAIAGAPAALRAPAATAPGRVEVRGELYISRADFAALNDARAAREPPLKPYANARNAAAGALRRLDGGAGGGADAPPRVPLRFFAYDAVYGDAADAPPSLGALREALSAWGFEPPTPYARVVAEAADDGDGDGNAAAAALAAALAGYHAELRDARGALSYEIDGAVYKVDDAEARGALGHAARAPRWAAAHKFAAKTAATTLEGIDVAVGRLGALTPVARLAPVRVGGVVVRSASLHNVGIAVALDARVNDTVVVERAGDVIPRVVEVRLSGDGAPPRGPAWEPPTHCPACGAPAVRDGDGAAGNERLRCDGGFACPPQAVEAIAHLCSRDALDITGLGPGRAKNLYDLGILAAPADIFGLAERERRLLEAGGGDDATGETALAKLDGWGDKSAEKLLRGIERRRSGEATTLGRVLYGMGLRHHGRSTADAVAALHGGDGKRWLDAAAAAAAAGDDAEAAAEAYAPGVPGVAAAAAGAAAALYRDDARRGQLEALLEAVELAPMPEGAGAAEGEGEGGWAGEVVVFTGALSVPRRDAAALAERSGAAVGAAVTAATTLVVAPDGFTSRKIEAARARGVRVVSEEEFVRGAGGMAE